MLFKLLKIFLPLFEVLELTKLMNTWRPILVFLLNFVVGILVTQGVIPTNGQDQLVKDLADALGYLIIFITSVAAIYHTLKHPHPLTTPSPVASTPVKSQPEVTPVFTPTAEVNAGTPPPLE
jgi:hypothetical protein